MKGKIRLISSMLIFGSIGAFVKNINLSSMDIAFLRAVIGCIFLTCTGLFIRQKVSFRLIKKNLLLLVISGVAIGFNWILLFQAYKYTTLSNATLSYYFAPVFVLILSPVILKEKLTISKVLCITAAMTGLFMILNVNGSSTVGSYNHIKGILYGLSGAALYASVILMNKFIKDLSGFETTLIQLSAAALVLLPSILYEHSLNLSSLSLRAIIFIFVVGIIHTGIAYLLYFTSMKEINGQSIAILSYIDPIFAVFISVVFLGESMTHLHAVGGILILGSTFLSERFEILSQSLNKA